MGKGKQDMPFKLPMTANWRKGCRKALKKRHSAFYEIVLAHLLKVRRDIFLACMCILGTTLATLLVPWPMKLIFDNVLSNKALPAMLEGQASLLPSGSSQTLLILCGSMIVLALIKGFFSYYQLFLTSRIGYLLVYTLRGELFNHLQRLSLSFHYKTRTGELLSKLTSDTNTLKDVFADSALTFTTHLLSVTGMLANTISAN